ncbi:GNAT family N-acetyltransferase [Streptomyces sp. NPDC059070]|uniref:GNAT family N-acetyltransferase n=1 Tax=Streptomyces sp. NPDC059070 TaxID=3346713 RepID=UPI0036B41531
MDLDLHHITADGLSDVREVLVDLYVEIYATQRDVPFYSREQITERLDIHTSCDAWEAVIAYCQGEPIGYAYGARLPTGSGWWTDTDPPLPAEFTEENGTRTMALFEIMVRESWRKTGTAERIHAELLSGREEERITLLVDLEHAGVKNLYERWGYKSIGSKQPFPDSPRYTVMVRNMHEDLTLVPHGRS